MAWRENLPTSLCLAAPQSSRAGDVKTSMISTIMDLAAYVRQALDWMRRVKMRRRAAQDLRRSLALIVDLGALEASVATRIQEFFAPDILVILQLDNATSSYRPSFCSGISQQTIADVSIDPQGKLARWFRINETCLVVNRDHGVLQYLDEVEQKILERLEVKLCAPLMARNYLGGMLLLGTHRAWRPSRRDAELMLQLSTQASLAFQNAALYSEQRRRLDRLHRADRLAAVGQLAAGVAHEVRNPLTAIRSTMQYLAGSFDNDAKRELVSELIGEVDRIDETISGLLRLTRVGELQLADVDLVTLLRQTLRLVSGQARKQNVRIEEQIHNESLPSLADEGQLKQVFLNLILNALQAMPKGGEIVVTAKREHATTTESPRARIDISDSGAGIAADQLKSVFDPLFTTKSDGTGLGLAICHGIIQRHQGEIELTSTEGQGTTASIQLPIQMSTDAGND